MDYIRDQGLGVQYFVGTLKSYICTYLSDCPSMCNMKYPDIYIYIYKQANTVNSNPAVFYLGYSWEKDCER